MWVLLFYKPLCIVIDSGMSRKHKQKPATAGLMETPPPTDESEKNSGNRTQQRKNIINELDQIKDRVHQVMHLY